MKALLKGMLTGLLAGVLTLTASAQNPLPTPTPMPMPMPGRAPVVSAPGAPVLSVPGAPLPGGVVVTAPYGAGCCQDTCKVCKPIVETKTIIKRVYGEECEDFCLPKCGGLSLFGGCCGSSCGDCGDGHDCGKVMTKKYLIVRQRKCEECVNKCVVTHVPAAPCVVPCPTPCPTACPTPCATPCNTPKGLLQR